MAEQSTLPVNWMMFMRFDCERGKGLFMSQMDCLNRLPEQIREKVSFHSYGHALEILTEAFPAEWSEL